MKANIFLFVNNRISGYSPAQIDLIKFSLLVIEKFEICGKIVFFLKFRSILFFYQVGISITHTFDAYFAHKTLFINNTFFQKLFQKICYLSEKSLSNQRFGSFGIIAHFFFSLFSRIKFHCQTTSNYVQIRFQPSRVGDHSIHFLCGQLVILGFINARC